MKINALKCYTNRSTCSASTYAQHSQ